LRANLKSISHRCHPILVAFVLELTKETIDLPLGCLQGGVLKWVWPCAQHEDDALRGEKPAAVAKLEASLQAQMSKEVVSAVNDERRRTDVSSNTPHILRKFLKSYPGWYIVVCHAGRLISPAFL